MKQDFEITQCLFFLYQMVLGVKYDLKDAGSDSNVRIKFKHDFYGTVEEGEMGLNLNNIGEMNNFPTPKNGQPIGCTLFFNKGGEKVLDFVTTYNMEDGWFT